MIDKCVFPVAGLGTRFLPVTKSVPKEMLPILSTPLIEFAVKEAYGCGISEMVMVTNPSKESIFNYFQENEELNEMIKDTNKSNSLSALKKLTREAKFSYLYQKEALGLGHAIHQAKDYIDGPFAVILSDDLCSSPNNSVLEQLINVYKKNPDKCIVALEEVPDEHIHKYGIVDGTVVKDNILKINSMIEKPTIEEAPSNLAIIGRYILLPEVFKILDTTMADRNGEIQITTALIELAKKGKVLGCKYSGKRFDCGSVDGYIDANIYFRDKKLIS